MYRRVPLVLLLLAMLCVLPGAVAAAEPRLTATAVPGREIDVAGAGFPSDADVLLTIQRNGADDGTQTLHTDASGSFVATIDAGPGRGGRYLIVATSSSAEAVVEVVAVETAGAGGVRPTPPDTSVAMPFSSSSGSSRNGLPAAGAIIAIAVAVLASLAVARRRTGAT
jgi:hypothetical protein